ncbi:omptin family outer membrane protease [Treponema porcinum]|uniref:omptin family outer membrane protease n=1 Tax=Treponema porcinum TaxID=261392 RepID=UPI00235315F6|nr:omptin family outer membrane protease [Treponema porcinum]
MVEPLFGCQYGTLYEYVFANYGTSKSYRKLSQLDWEMKPIFYAGGKADILYKLFDFSFYGGGFFSTKCGETSDSDWLSDSDKDMETNYSISNNSLKRGGFCGTSFSASFPVLSWLTVSPSVSVDYEYYYFSARDGYGYYGDSKHSKSKTNVAGQIRMRSSIRPERLPELIISEISFLYGQEFFPGSSLSIFWN